MPQFQLDNFAPQFIWMVISFAILYFGIVSVTLPRLGRAIEARDGQIRGDIALAEAAKAEADKLAAEHDASIAAAHDKAREWLEAARHKAASMTESRLAQASARLDDRFAKADAALDSARVGAMGQIEDMVADLAADIVDRLIGRRPVVADASAAALAALA